MTVFEWCIICAFANCGLWALLDKVGVLTWMQFKVKEEYWPSRCFLCFILRLSIVESFIFLLLHLIPWWSLPLLSLAMAAPCMFVRTAK